MNVYRQSLPSSCWKCYLTSRWYFCRRLKYFVWLVILLVIVNTSDLLSQIFQGCFIWNGPMHVKQPWSCRATNQNKARTMCIAFDIYFAFSSPNETWWCHQMGTFSALLAICAWNSPVTGEFLHKGQWRGALRFSLICVSINCCVNNRQAGDLRRHRAHYDVILMMWGACSMGVKSSGSPFHIIDLWCVTV